MTQECTWNVPGMLTLQFDTHAYAHARTRTCTRTHGRAYLLQRFYKLGLLPVGTGCNAVSTTGLAWNWEQQRVEFGGMISSSNRCTPGTAVVVDTSHPIIWTAEYSLPTAQEDAAAAAAASNT